MFGTPFAHDELAKYSVIFGTLFKNIVITRDDEEGKAIQTFKIPVGYGPREKALARTESDPDLNRPYAELLPRITYEMTGFEYDGSRKLSSLNRFKQRKTNNGQKISYDGMFMPVPYNFNFELTILANRISDAVRIVGSILPYFRPDITVSANIIEEMPDYIIDIPIVLNSIEPRDEYEDDFRKRRIIEYKLSFSLKADVYGPASEAKIIKIAKINMYSDKDGEYEDKPIERYITQPGLTSDGKPTSDLAQTISPYLIEEDDNYGYIVTVQDKDLD